MEFPEFLLLVSPVEGTSALALANLVRCTLLARMDRHARNASRPHHHHHHHHHQAVCLKCALVLSCGACTMDLNGRPMADRATGAARRRRERRLRSWWRHERMSIACAPAEALHHSSGTKLSTCDTRVVEGATNDALRGQNNVTRAREGEVRVVHHALLGQTRPLPEMRPAPVQEPRPQEGIQRRGRL